MQEKDNGKYVEWLMVVNNIKPNHVIASEAPKKPKVAADMEKIASVIGIKNITWSETRTHASGHEKIKGDARREVLAKSPVYAEAQVRYAIYHLTCRMGIFPDKLRITESKIMWIKADRETIALLKHVKAEAHKKQQPINIEFMEFTPRNHQKNKKWDKAEMQQAEDLQQLLVD